MKNYKIIVFGTVQGVGFRYTTKAIADNMGIKGIVRNQSDGTVYIEAQGNSLLLSQFIYSIKAPKNPFAKVTKIEVSEIPVKTYNDFSVTY